MFNIALYLIPDGMSEHRTFKKKVWRFGVSKPYVISNDLCATFQCFWRHMKENHFLFTNNFLQLWKNDIFNKPNYLWCFFVFFLALIVCWQHLVTKKTAWERTGWRFFRLSFVNLEIFWDWENKRRSVWNGVIEWGWINNDS